MLGRPLLLVLAAAVLVLAVFNLTFRLGSEGLTEWDESLYVTTALEIVDSHDWVGTTFRGTLDYSNSKPPLNVWLVALSTRAFGVSLVALRLPSTIAALLTVLVLLLWTWHRFNPVTGVLSALVGAGGGFFSIPFLTWSNVAMHTAVGTSAALSFPIAVFTTLGNVANGWNAAPIPSPSLGFVYLPALIGIAATSVITAPYGARLAHRLPVATLKRTFAILLYILALKMLYGVLTQ